MTTHKCSGCGACGAFWRPNESGGRSVIRSSVRARCETCGKETEWKSAAMLAQADTARPQDHLMTRGGGDGSGQA